MSARAAGLEPAQAQGWSDKAPAGASAAWGECGWEHPPAPASSSPPRHSSTTKKMRLSILADLHVEMNPEGNLELVTSDCKSTLEEVQSTEEADRSALQFSSLWDLGNG